MFSTTLRFAAPYNVSLQNGTAVVTQSSTGAVHRLTGPAVTVVRHMMAGETNPSLWTRDAQDALAVLCDLGVVEFTDHTPNRRTMIAGATALGITVLAMPTALAAESVSGGGGTGAGGVVNVFDIEEVTHETWNPGNHTTAKWTSGYDIPAFDVVDDFVEIAFMIVGGGGGGASIAGGGGGGGQVYLGTELFAAGTYTIRVGVGGNPGVENVSNGATGHTSLIQLSPGGTTRSAVGGFGGVRSGGKGGDTQRVTGPATWTTSTGGTGSGIAGGGGGGANQNGGNAVAGDSGSGGDGFQVWDFFALGLEDHYGGGGAGGATDDRAGNRGIGGGGGGGAYDAPGDAGVANTGGGGGGGGGDGGAGAAGGSGFVAIRTVDDTPMNLVSN